MINILPEQVINARRAIEVANHNDRYERFELSPVLHLTISLRQAPSYRAGEQFTVNYYGKTYDARAGSISFNAPTREWSVNLELRTPPKSVAAAEVTSMIAAQLRRVLSGPRADVIARTEAARAFNAVKLAEIRGTSWKQFDQNLVKAATDKLAVNHDRICKKALLPENVPGIAPKKETNVKPKIKKFYVAHPKIADTNDRSDSGKTWAKDTLEEAIAHAKQLCEKSGNDQYVVKIVKRVRRQALPIAVEEVK